jgi:hypothetical protein
VMLLIAALGLAVACSERDRGADPGEAMITGHASRVCEALGLRLIGGEALPPTWDACTVALRASMAMAADTATLLALGARPMAPAEAELQWLTESELGSTAETRFLSVLLRLPRAAHDVEVRFDTTGAVTYVSAVHKPLQR